MKQCTYISLLIALLTLSNIFCFAQTQSEMNEAACQEAKKADVELNDTYQRILKDYKQDALFIKKLKTAQRAWVVFRDAHLESLYPKENKRVEYGSVYPTCHCNEIAALTKRRTEELKRWVQGIEEGDVCAGSIKTNK